MNTRHTPGPWTAQHIDDASSARELWRVCGPDSFVCSTSDSDQPEADANLIAAAPTTAEMAMAFTLLVESFVRHDIECPAVSESELADAMYALRAHIAKATGGAA